MLSLLFLFACVEETVDVPTVVEDLDADGFTIGEGDCNDQDPNVSPSAPDVFGDSMDQNCDGADGIDGDGDGFAGVATGGTDCDDTNPEIYDVDKDGDGESMCDGDCDDLDGMLNHWDQDLDGQSSCDGDCDDTNPYIFVGAAPEDDITLCMKDRDGDGYGDSTLEMTGLSQGTDCDDEDELLNDTDFDADGQSSCGGDCNDFDPTAYAGAALLDSLSDCMRDIDGDGYGDQFALPPVIAGTDCDDAASDLNPTDVDGDGFSTCDGDCDDANPYYDLLDFDQDGFSTCDGDCDDEKVFVFPGAAEFDSATQCLKDEDYDGYGDSQYIRPGTDCHDNDASRVPIDVDGDGYSTCTGDCDETSSATYPGAAYIDFPNSCVLDFDGDGYASIALNGADCNDFDTNVNPLQLDGVGDFLDRNCDGHDGVDADGDAQASIASGGVDCNDGDNLIHDLDLDGDGLGICSGDCDDNLAGLNQLDEDADGFTTCDGDCDDQNEYMFPGSAELDSLTSCLEDVDGDGYGSNTAFNVGSDCDDLNFNQNYYDVDGDGFASCQGDCNDNNPNIFPMLVGSELVCESPQIELLVQSGIQEVPLGCPETFSLVFSNTGSSDLTITSVTSSDSSVATIELLEAQQGTLPFVIEPGDTRTGFVQSLDLDVGTYTVDMTIESDSVLGSTSNITLEYEIVGRSAVQHTVTFGQPEDINFILIPENQGTQQERAQAFAQVEHFVSALIEAGHNGSIAVLDTSDGCVQTVNPLTLQGLNTTQSQIDTLSSLGTSGAARFDTFLQELITGCNTGLLDATLEVVPIFLGLGEETTVPSEVSSLSSTQQGFTIGQPVLISDSTTSCGGESFPVLQGWTMSNSGQVWDVCVDPEGSNSFWASLYGALQISSNEIPVPAHIWVPGMETALNNVELTSGWAYEDAKVSFDSQPLDGDVVTLTFQLTEVCH